MNLDDIWRLMLERVNANRFTMQHVMPTESTPSMTYTIGMAGSGFPDFVIVGVPSVVAATLLSTIARRVLEAKCAPSDGQVFDDVANFPLKVVYSQEPNAYGINRYCNEYSVISKVMRVVYPGPDGVFVDEERKPVCKIALKTADCALDLAA